MRTQSHNTVGGSTKRRRKLAEEFLVQMLYQRRMTGNSYSDSVIMTESQQLEHGKTGAALHACAKKSFGSLVPRLQDHGGICFLFSSFDRACFGPLSKAVAGVARHEWRQGLHEGSHPLAPLAEDLLWCVAAPCSLHDCHNGFKWGMASVFAKSELWKELYVAVVSCRSMSFPLAEVLSSWLNTVMSFVDDDAVHNANFLYDYYALLGALSGACEILAHTLRMTWDGSTLVLPVSLNSWRRSPLSC